MIFLRRRRRDVVRRRVVAGVEVVGLRRELGGQRVDLREVRRDAVRLAQRRARRRARRRSACRWRGRRSRAPSPRAAASASSGMPRLPRAPCASRRSGSMRAAGTSGRSASAAWIVVDAHAVAQRLGDGEDAERRGVARARRAVSSNPNASGSRPSTPMSSMRSAFWITSGKVRPIAITSPTLFISLPISHRRALELRRDPSAAPCRPGSRAPARRRRSCAA